MQDKLDLRKDYETRLTDFKVKYEREHQQLHDLLNHKEKQFEAQTSKASLTHIEHNKAVQNTNKTLKDAANEKRQLEAHIQNKNK